MNSVNFQQNNETYGNVASSKESGDEENTLETIRQATFNPFHNSHNVVEEPYVKEVKSLHKAMPKETTYSGKFSQ